jgi:hypothetical protein
MPNLSDLSSAVLATMDPFSIDFLSQVESIKENIPELENPVNKKVKTKLRVRKNHGPLFELSKPLKKRLKTLHNKTEDEEVRNICESLLLKKYQADSTINYLGLSRDDFSKLSYMDNDRIQRYKSETYKNSYIGPGAVVTVTVESIVWHDYCWKTVPNKISMKLSKSHIPNPISCYKNEEGKYILDPNAQVRFYSRKLSTELQGRKDADENNVLTSLGWRPRDFEVDLVEEELSMVWNADRRYHSTVGKVVRKVFGDKFRDHAICKFSEEYFNLIIVNDTNYDLLLVKGNEIRKYYNSENYLPSNNSQLWNSCMRYEGCQEYFSIYENSPNCELAVLLYKNKVSARCLVWKNNDGKYIDRVYAYNNKSNAILLNQLLEKGYKDVRKGRAGYFDGAPITIPAEYVEDLVQEGARFPYMDTFRFYLRDSKVLSPDSPSGSSARESYYSFTRTDGRHDQYADSYDETCCSCCGAERDSDDLYSMERGRYSGEYLCDGCVVYSEVLDEYIYDQEAVRDFYGDYMHISTPAITLTDGSLIDADHPEIATYANGFGYFLLEEEGTFPYMEIDGEYYHPDDESMVRELMEKDKENEENEENNDYNEQNTFLL